MEHTNILDSIQRDWDAMARYQRDLRTIVRGGSVPNLTADGARHVIAGLDACIRHKRRLLDAD